MKKILSLILSLCMVLTVVGNIPMTVSAAPRLTLSEAMDWLEGTIGTNIDYDKVEGYQCVDLIKAYYGQLATWVATGNAIDYANPSKEYIYKDYGWTMYSNMYQTEDVKSVSETTPRPGDIIVFNWQEPYSGEWLGHIGIVYAETSNNTVYYVDQNGDAKGAVCTKRSQPLSEVYGIIRPDFDVEGEEQECTSHNYANGTCSKCGDVCSHKNYTVFQTVKPTCTEGGVWTYTCKDCGNKTEKAVPSKGGHNYVDGTCQDCGAVKYTMHTANEALAWLENQIGKQLDQDKVEGYQCVDLIKEYQVFLCGWPQGGDAIHYANPENQRLHGWYGWELWSNMSSDKKPSQTTPQPGDIVVFNWSAPYGHIGIVYAETSNNTVYYVDQNGDANGAACTKRSTALNQVYAIIRPDFITLKEIFPEEFSDWPSGQHTYVDGYCSTCGEMWTDYTLTYSINDARATITGYTGTLPETLEIPYAIDGYLVTEIAYSAFYNADSIKRVIMHDEVKTIGGSAFYSCDNLTSVKIGEKVETIGGYAFAYCDNLKKIIIPDSVKTIGVHAFYDCDSLSVVKMGGYVETIDYRAFGKCDNLRTIYFMGTQKKWSQVEINDEYYDTLANANIVCIDSKGCTVHTYIDGYCGNCGKLGVEINFDDYVYEQNTREIIVIENGISNMKIYDTNGLIRFGNILKVMDSTKYVVELTPHTCGTTQIVITDGNDNVIYTSENVSVFMKDRYFGLNLDGTVNYDEINQVTAQEGNETIQINLDDYAGISAEVYNIIMNFAPEKIVFRNSKCGWTMTVLKEEYLYYNLDDYIDISLTMGNTNPYYDILMLANNTISSNVFYIEYRINHFLTDPFGDVIISLDHNNKELSSWLKNNNVNSVSVLGRGKAVAENLSKDNITFTHYSYGTLFIADTSNADYCLLFSKYKNSSDVDAYGYSGTLPEVLEIPSEVAGYPVTTIGNSAFKNAKTLKKVIMPNSIVDMDHRTFYGCENLEEVVLSQNLESMGAYEFGKTNIKHIKIPAKVKYNLDNTFNEVELDTIEVDENNAVFKSEGNCLIQIFNHGDKGMYEELVKGTNNSVIPEGVTYISPFAFENCTKLKEINIPKSVTGIGRNPFIGCVGLEKITVDEENEYFHSDGNCLIETEENAVLAGTANSVIPDYIISIEDRAFYNISNLTEITLPDGLENIGEQAFAGTGIETITIPGSVYFWEWAWYGAPLEECKNLTEIIFEYGIEEISFEIFNGITSLRTITIPNSVTFIGYYTFENYDNLETVYFIGTEEEWNKITIGDGNESLFKANIIFVCDHTFSNNVCSKCGTELNISTDGKFESIDTTVTGNITVPLASNGVSVSTIGAGAFKNCASLSSVMIYDNVTEIADDAFEGVSDNFVIKCYEDSPISVWAEEKGVTYEIVPIPYGNVNADETTDIFDLIALAKHTVGNSDAIDTRAANTNASDKADRNIDIFDLIALAKHICNPEFTLGPKA